MNELKRKEYNRKYYENNKDSVKQKSKEYRDNNKDKVRERNRRYVKNNLDKVQTARKEYCANNKDKIKEYKRNYGNINKNKLIEAKKTYYLENKDRINNYAKKRYEKNKDEINNQKKDYYEKNKDKINNQKKKYREKNKDKVAKYMKEYAIENRGKLKEYAYLKYNNDISFKLRMRLRGRLVNAIKQNNKSGSAVEDLGCSIQELKDYLESKFTEGMNWDNWSKTGWHIDHIKPLASFDLTDPEQFKQACHYSNLQPLWATDNLSKGAKIIDKKQSLEHTANNTQSLQPRKGILAFDDEIPKDPNGKE